MIERTSYSVIAKLRSAKFFLYKHRIYSTYSQITPPITKPMDLVQYLYLIPDNNHRKLGIFKTGVFSCCSDVEELFQCSSCLSAT